MRGGFAILHNLGGMKPATFAVYWRIYCKYTQLWANNSIPQVESAMFFLQTGLQLIAECTRVIESAERNLLEYDLPA